MSWLFGGSGGNASAGSIQFEDLLNKCTSELLPTPSTEEGALDSEFEVALQLSDIIRSGQVKAADAVKSFRRKLASHNPNVQLRALITLDTAIKNSGDAFLQEVAGVSSGSLNSAGAVPGTVKLNLTDQLDDLVRASFNHDVRNLATRLVQTWATAFQSKANLSISNMVLLYTRLKAAGCQFPPVSTAATSAMIDSLSAPSWSANEESDRCERCRDPFTLTNRRHHCRNCGLLFDQKCSSHSMPLPHFGIAQPVRVCDGCYKKIESGAPPIPRPEPPAKLQPRDATYYSKSREDEDLQLALRLSLESAPPGQGAQSTGYNPSYDTPAQRGRKVTTDVISEPMKEEEEDEDLKRAIEASLKDMELASGNPYAQPTHTGQYPQQEPQNYSTQASSSYLQPLPNTDLSDGELTSLLTFSQSVLSPNPSAPPTVHDLQPSYERAEASRTALVKNLRETVGREMALTETRDKMREIMRLYEARLDRQLQRSTANQYSHYAAPPQQPHLPAYPHQYTQTPQPSMYPSMYNQPQQQQFQQQQYYAPPPSMYPQLAQPGPEAYGMHPSQYQQSQVQKAPIPQQDAQSPAPQQVSQVPSSPAVPQGHAEPWNPPSQSTPAPVPSSPPVHQEDRPVYAEASQPPASTEQPAGYDEHLSAPSAPEFAPSAPEMPAASSPPIATAPLQSPILQQGQTTESYVHEYASAPPQPPHPQGLNQHNQPSAYGQPGPVYPYSPQPQQPYSTQTAGSQPMPFNKLANLPGAPQDRPFAAQQFPSVPHSDIAMRQQEPSPKRELAPLIDL